MPDLSFRVDHVEVVPFAMAPTLRFALAVENTPPTERIHTVVLRVQIQIDVARRRYTSDEEESLRDLFGEPSRWGQTLRTMLWTHANAIGQSFVGSTAIELLVPCSFDFNVAATKYFHGLTGGEVPIRLLFSGSTFYQDPDGMLQVAPISWDKEVAFRLPVAVWRDLMDAYYPNQAWLHLRRDVFDRLYRHKVARGIPTWEQALEAILAEEERAV